MEITPGSLVLHHDLANQLRGLQESSGYNNMGAFLEHLFALEEQSRSQQCLSALFEQPWLENYSPTQTVNPDAVKPARVSVGVQVKLCCSDLVADGEVTPVEESTILVESYTEEREEEEDDEEEVVVGPDHEDEEGSAADSDAESRLELGADYAGKEEIVQVAIAYEREASAREPVSPGQSAPESNGVPAVPLKLPPPSQRRRRSYPGKHPGYTCEDCGEQFKHRLHYVHHMQEHRGVKTPTKCPHCPRTLLNLWRLRLHISAKHPEHAPPPRDKPPDEPILCHLCGKAVGTRHAYNNHLRTHTDERPYTCPLCPRTFKYASARHYHLRTHTDERMYECHLCDKKYRYESNLSKHQRFHTGEKPYACPHCDKRFTAKPTLKDHVHKQHDHPGIKAFKCPVCGKAYSRKFNMNVHMKKKHLQPKPARLQNVKTGRRRSRKIEHPDMTNVVSKGFADAADEDTKSSPVIVAKLASVSSLAKGPPAAASAAATIIPVQLTLPVSAATSAADGPDLAREKVSVELKVNGRSRKHRQAEIELAEVMAGMVSS